MKKLTMIAMLLCAALMVFAQQERFCIAQGGTTSQIVVDENDWKGVLIAAGNLGDDVRKVTGKAAPVVHKVTDGKTILVGTIGKSRIIDQLVKKKKIDVKKVKGQWESYLIDVVDGNLVIAGSDKRGTLSKYPKYNLIRKPEIQYPGLFNHEEMLHMSNLWKRLALRCEALKARIPAEAQDAFYQLVYYPATASANLAEIYYAATMGDSITVNLLMEKDRRLTEHYNKGIAGGKWDSMMLDNHIGYTQWSIPEANRHPMSLGFRVDYSLNAAKDTREYSIAAYNYTRKDEGWIFLPDLGRGKGCMGAKDVMAECSASGDGPALEYEVELTAEGKIAIGILPTQDVLPERGLRFGVQLDDQPLQVVDARQGLHDEFQEYTPQNLARSKVRKALPARNRLSLSGFVNGRRQPRRTEVFDNLRWIETSFHAAPGKHRLKIVMIDPEIVVEQLVVNPDNSRYSYFGNGFPWTEQ